MNEKLGAFSGFGLRSLRESNIANPMIAFELRTANGQKLSLVADHDAQLLARVKAARRRRKWLNF
jgi:hypothetical protein